MRKGTMMIRTHPQFEAVRIAVLYLAACLGGSAGVLAAEEPPALNPFGPVRQDRQDAEPGYVELSDGRVYVGSVYMTRDKRLKIWDANLQRQREIPLRAIRQIECKVEKEWMEREWRFKELALDEKMYTGRKYPARLYVHTVTLRSDGRTITGPLAEIIYVRPYAAPSAGLDASKLEPQRFLLHKRDKGPPGTDLKSLVYVKLVKLGKDAYEEGLAKAAKRAKTKPGPAEPRAARKAPPVEERDADEPAADK